MDGETKTYTVSFTINVPTEISKDNVEKWLNFELGATGSMKNDNPLCGTDLEANSFSVSIH